ncbi:MAG: right-handed parallel beta-helix repeat-containing protein [Phycisphaerae bacterium]|nr:right-handed parallel beta-helix repeat-containing protein [Phycisphaerae bacterium]
MKRKNVCAIIAWAGLVCCGGMANAGREEPDWVEPMRQVHAGFAGEPGTLAHFGDSITVTLAYWTPLLYARNNASPEMERAWQMVYRYMKHDCWRLWKGAKYGSQSGMTIRWASEHVEEWLDAMNPETAVIMFGTNDLNSVPLEEYREKTRRVVQKCLDNGTVVILSTIPPRRGFVEKAAVYADAVRRIAREMKVPLIDFHAEIMQRRPDDWDGTAEKFAAYEGYNVPTLLARDGVHPSNPQKYQDDYSAEALAHSGYMLRNYLSLMKHGEVIERLGLAQERKKDDSAAEPAATVISLTELTHQEWLPKAPALPPPAGAVRRAGNVRDFIAALDEAKPGTTILLEDGHYMMPHYVAIRTDGVTLRSASGNRQGVVIDGMESRDGELIGITACSGVTIADLTIQNIRWNGFKINSETGVQDLTLYNCVVRNIWQRGVKGVKVPLENRETIRPRNCRISYCLFYNDRPKQFSDDPADTPANFNGDYIGGIDVMYAAGWTISDNVFVGIQGRTRQGRGAIFVWHDSQDCVIERNVIIDCDAGVCLGNPHRPQDVRDHCTRCVVRNNFITRGPQAGIVTVYTRDCRLLNNSIYEPESRFGRLIRVVFDNEGLFIANNLLCGPDVRMESDSPVRQAANVAGDLASLFVDPARGDLHLARVDARVIDRGVELQDGGTDIDRQVRDGKPDLGAHEFRRRGAND